MTDIPPLADLKSFCWPDGKRAALSLSLDDAQVTQPDVGFEILDRYGVRATFYVIPKNVEKRLEAWKKALCRGHEIGNHTVTHPCSCAGDWTRRNTLEDYTLERITAEIDDATEKIHSLLGVRPKTFAYPCGQDWVGRGQNRRSYVPLVAERFLIARGGRGHAIPGFIDPAMVPSISSDQLSVEGFSTEIAQAVSEGNWLVLTGHDIAHVAGLDKLTTSAEVLTEICRFATDPAHSIWVDTVETIGTYVREQRSAK